MMPRLRTISVRLTRSCGVALRSYQHVESTKPDSLQNFLVLIDGRHQLADALGQNVSGMDNCQPVHR
jgi:hypothetical protein